MNKQGHSVKKLLIISILLVMAIGCSSQLARVTPVDQVQNIESKPGFFYCLPKTIVRVELPVIKTIKKKGPLNLGIGNADFIKEMKKIGIDVETDKDFIHSDTKSFSLGEAVITTFPKPDKDNTFFVEVDDKAFYDTNLTMTLTRDGLLEDAKSDSTNMAMDIGVEATKSIAAIAGKFFIPGAKDKTFPEKEEEWEKIHYVKQQVLLIKQLRSRRFELIQGDSSILQGGLPADTFKLVLEKLDEKENDLLNALRSTTEKKIWTAIFEFEPKRIKPEEDESNKSEIILSETEPHLCTLSSATGITNFSDYCINKYSYNLAIEGKDSKKSSTKADSKTITKVYLSVILEKTKPDLSIKSSIATEEGSFFYRIPVLATVELQTVKLKKDGGKKTATKSDEKKETKFATKLYLAHIGPLRQVPKEYKGKYGMVDLKFYTDTGGIKVINTQTKAATIGEAISTLGTSASELAEKHMTAEDEITQLKRKKEKLQLESDIRKLEAEKD